MRVNGLLQLCMFVKLLYVAVLSIPSAAPCVYDVLWAPPQLSHAFISSL